MHQKSGGQNSTRRVQVNREVDIILGITQKVDEGKTKAVEVEQAKAIHKKVNTNLTMLTHLIII